jgi:G3E family GTPase
LLRSKGFFWLASRMDVAGFWSQAGGAARIEAGGLWTAAIPQDDWPDDPVERAEILQQWEAPFGDRRQELVFIGIKMNRERIVHALDACLLTDEEMTLGPAKWAELPDPFGEWKTATEVSAHDHGSH